MKHLNNEQKESVRKMLDASLILGFTAHKKGYTLQKAQTMLSTAIETNMFLEED
jgi:hypothetical protein